MPKYSTSWLVKHKIPQGLILSNPSSLFPQGFSRWWCHPAHYYVTNFTFSMTGYDMNGFATPHGIFR
jgi:hypothetical protein